MWIDRLLQEVQHKGLWDSSQSINKAACCATVKMSNWENPARITQKFSIQIWLRFVNGLLRFNNSERIVAGPPQPLMNR
jgi:hypothetical protein